MDTDWGSNVGDLKGKDMRNRPICQDKGSELDAVSHCHTRLSRVFSFFLLKFVRDEIKSKF